MGANLDVLGIVVSPMPLPTPGYLDQAIVAAREADLTPVLVINKGDLEESETFVEKIIVIYRGLVDTPGFNEFGLVDISTDDLAGFFPGFEEAMEASCHFRDCCHLTEPGCAMSELVESGRTPLEWYATFNTPCL